MRVIARIPDLTPPVAAGARPCAAVRDAASNRPRARDGLLTGIVERGMSWTVVALAVGALMVWTLASWRDHSQLQRQRGEMRVAREAAAATLEVEGAVVR